MKKFILTLSLLASCFYSHATNEITPQGARSSGLANSSVTLFDVWSVFNNQAGLARVNSISAGIYYENRFLVKSLSSGSFAFALPTDYGTFGLSYYSFGTSGYRESKYGLAYGRSLGDKLNVGLQLNYLSTVLPENYGKFSGVNAELGVQAKLTDELIIGAHIYNLNRMKLPTLDDKILEYVPTIFKVGLQYKVSPKVILLSEVSKDIDNAISFRAGTEYSPNEILYIRIGVATNPSNYSFGFGYKLKSIALDISASYHQILGFTPQVGFNWNLNSSSDKSEPKW